MQPFFSDVFMPSTACVPVGRTALSLTLSLSPSRSLSLSLYVTESAAYGDTSVFVHYHATMGVDMRTSMRPWVRICGWVPATELYFRRPSAGCLWLLRFTKHLSCGHALV